MNSHQQWKEIHSIWLIPHFSLLQSLTGLYQRDCTIIAVKIHYLHKVSSSLDYVIFFFNTNEKEISFLGENNVLQIVCLTNMYSQMKSRSRDKYNDKKCSLGLMRFKKWKSYCINIFSALPINESDKRMFNGHHFI